MLSLNILLPITHRDIGKVKHHYPYFTDRKSEAQSRRVSCSRSHNTLVAELRGPQCLRCEEMHSVEHPGHLV